MIALQHDAANVVRYRSFRSRRYFSNKDEACGNDANRGGSVYLNSIRVVAKWIPASVRLPSGLMPAH